MSNILIVGEIYSETQYLVENLPSENQFVVASLATTYFGSKMVNAARVFSHYQNQVTFSAKVGNDKDGEQAVDVLKNWQIRPLLSVAKNQPTGKICVQTPTSGKSSVTLFRGANEAVQLSDIKKMQSEIEKCNCVYTSTSLKLELLYELVALSKKLNKPVFLDIPNQHAQLDLQKLRSVTFFAPNRQEAGLLLKRNIQTIEDAQRAALALKKVITGTVIITLDKDGCVVTENETKATHVQTAQVDTVDETAAGDIFRAAFVHFWLKKPDIQAALAKALYIATESVKTQGVDSTLKALL